MSKKLSTFYAVTVSPSSVSLFEVRDKTEEGVGNTVAEKIGLRGESAAPIGHKTASMMIAVCKCLIPYIPEGGGGTSYQRDIASVNTTYWGSNTSLISALFLDKEAALRCLDEAKLVPCDSRWLMETRAVIEAIGDDHPNFTVCHSRGLDLMEAVPAL